MESDEKRGKKGFMGWMGRKDKDKEKTGSPNHSPRAGDGSPRSPRWSLQVDLPEISMFFLYLHLGPRAVLWPSYPCDTKRSLAC